MNVPSQHGVRALLANTIAGLASNTGSAIVGLIATPVIVARLGVETFGFWAVVTAMVNYAGLVDGGLTSTFMKYVAEYCAHGHINRIRAIATFGAFFYLALGAIVTPLAIALSPRIIAAMHVHPSLARAGPAVVGAVIFSWFATNAAGSIGTILSGMGQLRIISLCNFIGRTAFAVCAVVLLYAGFGIEGMVVSTYAQTVVTALLLFITVWRRFGNPFIAPWHWERSVIIRLFKLGGWIQLTNVCSTLVVESNRLIISIFVSTSAVAYFEIANRLIRAARSLPFNFIVALLPVVSARNAVEDDQRFNAISIRANRYVNYATVLIVGFIIAAGGPLCYFWIGQDYPGMGTIVALVGVSFVLINATMVGTTMLRAVALARYEAYYYCVWTAASVASMIALVPRFGLEGVLYGMIIGAAVGTAYFYRLFNGLRSIRWSEAVRWGGQLLMIGSASIFATAALGARLAPHFHTRGAQLAYLAILAGCYCAVFAFATIVCKYFDRSDLHLARTSLGRSPTLHQAGGHAA